MEKLQPRHKTYYSPISMIFEFDKELAEEAVATRLGRVITKENREVVIESWECKVPDMPECSICGYLIDTGNHFYWTDEGKLAHVVPDPRAWAVAKDYELVIEVFEEDDINYKIGQYDL